MGRKLNIQVAELLGGWKIYATSEEWMCGGFKTSNNIIVLEEGRFDLPNYSDDLSQALVLHKRICRRRGLLRGRYLKCLTDTIRARVGKRIKWPELLAYIKPVDICKAGLTAYKEGH